MQKLLSYISIGLVQLLFLMPCNGQLRDSSKQVAKKSNILADYHATQDPDKKVRLLYKVIKKGFHYRNKKVLLPAIDSVALLAPTFKQEESKYILKLIKSYKYEHYLMHQQKHSALDSCITYFSKDRKDNYYLESLSLLGNHFFERGTHELSLNYLTQLHEAIDSDHYLYSLTVRRLTRVYSGLNQDTIALELISSLIEDYESQPNFKWAGHHLRHYMIKSSVLHKMGDTKEAIRLAEIALEKATQGTSKAIYNNCKSSLAEYYFSEGQIERARVLAQEAFNHYEILKVNIPSMINSRIMLGKIFYETDKEKSLKYYEEALEISTKHNRILSRTRAQRGIINCKISLGSCSPELVKELDGYLELNDSIFTENLGQYTQDLKLKHENEKKESAITQLNEKNEIIANHLSQAKRNNIFLIGALSLLLLSILGLWNLIRKRTNAQALLKRKNEIINKSLSDNELLLKEIHHRVKNNLQTVSSLLSLQSAYIEDENVLNALKDGQNRVQSMALIHQNLYQEEDLREINARSYLEKLTRNLYRSYKEDEKRVALHIDVIDVNLDIELMTQLGLIVNELISNVFKYAFPSERKGDLWVSLSQKGSGLELTVKDNGVGSEVAAQSEDNGSFGFQMIQAFCAKLGAQLHMSTDEGTHITIGPINNSKHE